MSDLKIEVVDIDPCTKRLDIELPFPLYQKELEKAYRALNRKVRVHGFRQGKTPLKVLERYYKDRVETEVLQKLAPDSCQEAIRQKNLKAVGQPRLEDVEVEKERPLKLLLTVEVKPELSEVVYEGLQFKKVSRKITQQEVDEETEALRERLAELVEKPDARIDRGDYAIIDYQPFIEGRPIPGEKKENHTLAVGDGSLEENFERQLLGMRKGEEKEITLRYPKDHARQELAGKQLVFQVKVREVKTKVLPPLDDEFARQVGEYETLKGLRDDIRTKLEEQEERRATNRLKSDIISRLVEKNPVQVPPSLVEEEINLRLLHFQRQLQQQGLQLNPSEEDLDEWRQKNREDATTQVKGNIILEKIAQLKGIEVSEQELEEELKKTVQNSKQNLQNLKKQMQDNGSLDRLRESLLREKTLNNIMESYKIELSTEEESEHTARQGHDIKTEQEKQ